MVAPREEGLATADRATTERDGARDHQALEAGIPRCADTTAEGQCSTDRPLMRCLGGELRFDCGCCQLRAGVNSSAFCDGATSTCRVMLSPRADTFTAPYVCDTVPGCPCTTANGQQCAGKPLGALTQLTVARWKAMDIRTAYIDFGVVSSIPAGVAVGEATLDLFVIGGVSGTEVKIDLIASPWLEATLTHDDTVGNPPSVVPGNEVKQVLKNVASNQVAVPTLVKACLSSRCSAFRLTAITQDSSVYLESKESANISKVPKLWVTLTTLP